MKSLKFFILLGMLCLLPSLSAQSEGAAGPGGGASLGEDASSSYVIRTLDYIRFRVIGEPETLVEARVSSEGTVSLPFIDSVEISGLTVSEARRKVFNLYNGDYYVNPQIDFTIIAYSDRSVEVLGYVIKQGSIAFPSEKPLYLMEAIARAGGFQELGDQKRVEIRRHVAGEEYSTIQVDTTDITSREYPLQDGDVVKIPRRVW
jgi:polysaccharide export outer membrane protein